MNSLSFNANIVTNTSSNETSPQKNPPPAFQPSFSPSDQRVRKYNRLQFCDQFGQHIKYADIISSDSIALPFSILNEIRKDLGAMRISPPHSARVFGVNNIPMITSGTLSWALKTDVIASKEFTLFNDFSKWREPKEGQGILYLKWNQKIHDTQSPPSLYEQEEEAIISMIILPIASPTNNITRTLLNKLCDFFPITEASVQTWFLFLKSEQRTNIRNFEQALVDAVILKAFSNMENITDMLKTEMIKDKLNFQDSFKFAFKACLSLSNNRAINESELEVFWERFDFTHHPKNELLNDYSFSASIFNLLKNKDISFLTLKSWLGLLTWIYFPRSLTQHDHHPFFKIDTPFTMFFKPDPQEQLRQVCHFIDHGGNIDVLTKVIDLFIYPFNNFQYPSPLSDYLPYFDIDIEELQLTLQKLLKHPNSFLKTIGVQLFLSLPVVKPLKNEVKSMLNTCPAYVETLKNTLEILCLTEMLEVIKKLVLNHQLNTEEEIDVLEDHMRKNSLDLESCELLFNHAKRIEDPSQRQSLSWKILEKYIECCAHCTLNRRSLTFITSCFHQQDSEVDMKPPETVKNWIKENLREIILIHEETNLLNDMFLIFKAINDNDPWMKETSHLLHETFIRLISKKSDEALLYAYKLWDFQLKESDEKSIVLMDAFIEQSSPQGLKVLTFLVNAEKISPWQELVRLKEYANRRSIIENFREVILAYVKETFTTNFKERSATLWSLIENELSGKKRRDEEALLINLMASGLKQSMEYATPPPPKSILNWISAHEEKLITLLLKNKLETQAIIFLEAIFYYKINSSSTLNLIWKISDPLFEAFPLDYIKLLFSFPLILYKPFVENDGLDLLKKVFLYTIKTKDTPRRLSLLEFYAFSINVGNDKDFDEWMINTALECFADNKTAYLWLDKLIQKNYLQAIPLMIIGYSCQGVKRDWEVNNWISKDLFDSIKTTGDILPWLKHCRETRSNHDFFHTLFKTQVKLFLKHHSVEHIELLIGSSEMKSILCSDQEDKITFVIDQFLEVLTANNHSSIIEIALELCKTVPRHQMKLWESILIKCLQRNIKHTILTHTLKLFFEQVERDISSSHLRLWELICQCLNQYDHRDLYTLVDIQPFTLDLKNNLSKSPQKQLILLIFYKIQLNHTDVKAATLKDFIELQTIRNNYLDNNIESGFSIVKHFLNTEMKEILIGLNPLKGFSFNDCKNDIQRKDWLLVQRQLLQSSTNVLDPSTFQEEILSSLRNLVIQKKIFEEDLYPFYDIILRSPGKQQNKYEIVLLFSYSSHPKKSIILESVVNFLLKETESATQILLDKLEAIIHKVVIDEITPAKLQSQLVSKFLLRYFDLFIGEKTLLETPAGITKKFCFWIPYLFNNLHVVQTILLPLLANCFLLEEKLMSEEIKDLFLLLLEAGKKIPKKQKEALNSIDLPEKYIGALFDTFTMEKLSKLNFYPTFIQYISESIKQDKKDPSLARRNVNMVKELALRSSLAINSSLELEEIVKAIYKEKETVFSFLTMMLRHPIYLQLKDQIHEIIILQSYPADSPGENSIASPILEKIGHLNGNITFNICKKLIKEIRETNHCQEKVILDFPPSPLYKILPLWMKMQSLKLSSKEENLSNFHEYINILSQYPFFNTIADDVCLFELNFNSIKWSKVFYENSHECFNNTIKNFQNLAGEDLDKQCYYINKTIFLFKQILNYSPSEKNRLFEYVTFLDKIRPLILNLFTFGKSPLALKSGYSSKKMIEIGKYYLMCFQSVIFKLSNEKANEVISFDLLRKLYDTFIRKMISENPLPEPAHSKWGAIRDRFLLNSIDSMIGTQVFNKNDPSSVLLMTDSCIRLNSIFNPDNLIVLDFLHQRFLHNPIWESYYSYSQYLTPIWSGFLDHFIKLKEDHLFPESHKSINDTRLETLSEDLRKFSSDYIFGIFDQKLTPEKSEKHKLIFEEIIRLLQTKMWEHPVSQEIFAESLLEFTEYAIFNDVIPSTPPDNSNNNSASSKFDLSNALSLLSKCDNLDAPAAFLNFLYHQKKYITPLADGYKKIFIDRLIQLMGPLKEYILKTKNFNYSYFMIGVINNFRSSNLSNEESAHLTIKWIHLLTSDISRANQVVMDKHLSELDMKLKNNVLLRGKNHSLLLEIEKQITRLRNLFIKETINW